MNKTYTLQEIAVLLGAKVQGDPNCVITGIGSLEHAKPGEISFLENPNLRPLLNDTGASAIILKEQYATFANKNYLIVENPYLGYSKVSVLFNDTPKVEVGIHQTAIIGKDCEIDETASIAPLCVLGNRVKIGASVRIEAGSIIGDECEIGADSRLCANVTLYHKIKMGQRCLIHSGVVLGSDGFGNANDKGVWHKVYQLGKVVIGNDVEIGANTTVDRGAIDDTIIEDGVRLDNQIQVGHNVIIGAHTAIAGCVGIAGSAKIGKYCMIGGGVGINGHIEIADGVIVTGASAVGKSITKAGVYSSGFSAVPHRTWWRILARVMSLEDLVNRVSNLENKHEHT